MLFIVDLLLVTEAKQTLITSDFTKLKDLGPLNSFARIIG